MKKVLATFFILSFSVMLTAQSTEQQDLDNLYKTISVDGTVAERARAYVDRNWDEAFIAPLIDLIFVSNIPKTRRRIVELLEKNTNQKLDVDPYAWWDWHWKNDPTYTPLYAEFKARLYKNVDPKFSTYFKNRAALTRIRLDEVIWGGVGQDGIPPLRDPDMIPSNEAKYLSKNDIVFGVKVNGKARAYPKRILGWHEMVVDNVGGRRIAGVYCTLCGTMIAYDTKYNGVSHDLGTSGFLYRSNKLMYDKATQSLWNTIEGQPVIGPLVDKDITLKTYPIITTTWGKWKEAHPNGLVMSPKTGHSRDYSPGAAYRRYYATDDLMFPVPLTDKRLSNKTEVFVIRSKDYKGDPLAVSTKYLKKNSIHHDRIGNDEVVIITDKKGGSRAYLSGGHQFERYKDRVLIDANGEIWQVDEEAISTSNSIRLERAPSHNIFWFAWFNMYPETRLVK